MKDCRDEDACSAFRLLQNIIADILPAQLQAAVSLGGSHSLNVTLGPGSFLQDKLIEYTAD